jgi:recombination protein RecA
MAKKAKVDKAEQLSSLDEFTNDLIKAINKDNGSKVAYNLENDITPTHVKRWISMCSRQLDYIVSNRKNGGLPEGRIIEIFGPPSIGKSHIAAQIAKSTQALGGIVVYIDTENATSVDNLKALGIDISKRFIYVDCHCTEQVLQIAESTILKAKAMSKDVPVTIIWDSVAASSPKAELEGDYDQNSIGLQARAISKGMRKITGVIADQNVLLVCLNQTRVKIGVQHADPTVVPGGNAIPFHASVRIKLGAGKQIQNKAGEAIGINVTAKIIKNKVSMPFRSCDFEIHFGIGIKEHEQMFDYLRSFGPATVNDKIIEVSGTGAWKDFTVTSLDGEVLLEKKFYKAEFNKLLEDPLYKPYLDDLIDAAYIRNSLSKDDIDIDPESYEEVKAVASELEIEDQMLEDL